jgi:hypothetical protein
VTVTFAGDDPAIVKRLEQFGEMITRSAWWRAVVDDYCIEKDCIGEGVGTSVRLERKLGPKTHDTEITTALSEAVKAGRFGALDANTLFVVYLPAGVEVHDAFVPKYCEPGPRAFHRSFDLDGKRVPFAVIPRCGDESDTTSTASHEILESTTNPEPSKPGFSLPPGSAALGFASSGLEPVDPCGLITMDDHRAFESGFVVQRAWSNREAGLGRNPCVPARADRPYIALVAKTPTVRLANVGDTATIDLEAAADRNVPRWAVSAFDLTGYQQRTSYVEAELDKHTVGAGETARLTLKLMATSPRQVSVVGVVSTLGTQSHLWPVAISMR